MQLPAPHRTVARLVAIATALVIGVITGCSDSTGPENVVVAIDPTSVTLLVGEGYTFGASVVGTDNTRVAWSATCGTVVGQGLMATYTAPAQAGTCTVTVTSNANSEKSASATVTVEDVAVTIDPATATMFVGQGRLFSATVSGTGDTGLQWSASCGTLSGSGASIQFTAPAQPGTCQVTATSTAYPGRSATSVVTVLGADALTNHLGNGTFDSDLVAWTVLTNIPGDGAPRAVWVDEDALGNPNSGSAELYHHFPGNGGTQIGLSACLPAEPGQRIVLGGSARMLEVVQGASPQIWVRAYSDAACTDMVGFVVALSFHEQATTTEWATLSTEGVIPDGASRIDVVVGIHKNDQVEEDATARFDNVFVSTVFD
ncbi:MAG TPA: hypothetical protein VNZ57_00030 [Longimicrobiales bacterium]|nr:hypothetical protein [Longimicrobiales bacterium]